MAPARMASSTSSRMALIWAALAGCVRSSRVAAKVGKRNHSPSPSSRFSGGVTGSGMGRGIGASDTPQLPPMMVVTPWLTLGAMSGLDSMRRSSWVCASMKPGAAMRPARSISTSPRSFERSPIRAMRSPRTPISPVKRGAPVPSTMLALRIRMSKFSCIRCLVLKSCLFAAEWCVMQATQNVEQFGNHFFASSHIRSGDKGLMNRLTDKGADLKVLCHVGEVPQVLARIDQGEQHASRLSAVEKGHQAFENNAVAPSGCQHLGQHLAVDPGLAGAGIGLGQQGQGAQGNVVVQQLHAMAGTHLATDVDIFAIRFNQRTDLCQRGGIATEHGIDTAIFGMLRGPGHRGIDITPASRLHRCRYLDR